jgi:thiamine biosynthesis lipoprotein ApbE
MKKSFYLVLTLSAISFLAGCGKPASETAFEPASRNCSASFRFEYNDVKKSASSSFDEASIQRAKKEAERFKAKYSGISCMAEKGGVNTRVVIDSDMDDLIKYLDAKLIRLKLGIK